LRRSIGLITLAFFSGFLTLSAGAQSATIESLYSLKAASDGSTPYSNLVEGPDGNYYGTAADDGLDGNGTIFRVTPQGVYTVLYAFQGGVGGQNPLTGLYLASDSNFYGTTARGGANGYGMVYRISQSGDFTSLYSFGGGADGASPFSGVIEGTDGNLYGTTSSGGAVNAAGFTGYGTIYQITPDGVLATIYTFTGGDIDGAQPYAGLVEGSDGFLYGTGNNDEVGNTNYEVGNIFKVSKTGAFTNLYHFQGGNDGGNPDGALVEGPDGSFYGSTHNFGLFANDDDDTGQGVLYNITPTGTFTTLYEFTGQADSGRPEGTLLFGTDGNLYGTTTNSPQGTLFQLTPAGGFATLGLLGNYAESLAGPIVGSDGNFYGTTDNAGANGNGTIFEASMSPALSPVVQLTLSSQTVTVANPVQLSWQVANAFSNTAQRCIASTQNSTLGGGGTWAGLQTGTLTGAMYGGSTLLTPTASGTYTYALTCGGTMTGFATLTVPAMTATTTSLPDATVGAAYSQTLTEQNGLAPFTWAVTSGSLPAGLTLDASTGAITGTPTQPGDSSFTVQVTDSESVPATASTSVAITVAASAPTVTTGASTLNISAPGATASMTLTISGFASNAFSFSCSGLPAKSECIFDTVTGSQAYGTTTLQVVTNGGLSAHADPKAAHTAGTSGLAMAAAIPGLLALCGFARKRRKKTLRLLSMPLFAVVMAGGLLTGCVGGSKTPTTTITDVTPAGTSTVTVTATAGDQSATARFTLQVQ
jgi:uncharacterized repeat protein (TIGR03803 family)